MAPTLVGKQAVVIGAGMGGLAAAGALADFFDQVVVLERDTLPSEPAHRAGTPQARHVHALFIDVNELTDRTENALKIIGDVYAARLFSLVGARLDLGRWTGRQTDEETRREEGCEDQPNPGVPTAVRARHECSPA